MQGPARLPRQAGGINEHSGPPVSGKMFRRTLSSDGPCKRPARGAGAPVPWRPWLQRGERDRKNAGQALALPDGDALGPGNSAVGPDRLGGSFRRSREREEPARAKSGGRQGHPCCAAREVTFVFWQVRAAMRRQRDGGMRGCLGDLAGGATIGITGGSAGFRRRGFPVSGGSARGLMAAWRGRGVPGRNDSDCAFGAPLALPVAFPVAFPMALGAGIGSRRGWLRRRHRRSGFRIAAGSPHSPVAVASLSCAVLSEASRMDFFSGLPTQLTNPSSRYSLT